MAQHVTLMSLPRPHDVGHALLPRRELNGRELPETLMCSSTEKLTTPDHVSCDFLGLLTPEPYQLD
jgi:hypothetical protein